MADFLFTLHTGREEMKTHLAIVFDDISDLRNKLNLFFKNKSTKGIFSVEADLSKMKSEGHKAGLLNLTKGNEELIVESWVQGNAVPWKEYYENKNVRRISLLNYPFETVRFSIIPEYKIEKLKTQQ